MYLIPAFEIIAPQMMSMLGSSYPTSGGTLSQSQIQAANNTLSSMGMLNDMNSNDMSPFDLNDFPQLTGRPNSAGGSQGQSGNLFYSRISDNYQLIFLFPSVGFSCSFCLSAFYQFSLPLFPPCGNVIKLWLELSYLIYHA